MHHTASTAPSNTEQEIHLRDYLRVLKKHRFIIVLFLLTTVVSVGIGTWAMTPIYKSSIQVLIERDNGPGLLEKVGLRYDPQFQETQYQIIKSRNVIERVVRQLHLDIQYKDALSKHGWFTSVKNMLGDKSPQVAQHDQLVQKIVSRIVKNLEVEPGKNSHIASISYYDPDPEMSRRIVEAIAQAYKDELLEMKIQNDNYSLVKLSQKANEEKKKLEKLEQALQQFVRDSDVITVENKVAVIPQKLNDFGKQLADAQARRAELEEQYQQVISRKGDVAALEALPLFASNPTLRLLQNKLLEVDKKLAELSKKYGPKHPKMIKAMHERKVLLDEKNKEIRKIIELAKNNLALARASEEGMKRVLQAAKQDTQKLNEQLVRYHALEREVETSRVLYDALIKTIKEQGVTQDLQKVKVWVVEKAITPDKPAKPKKILNLLLAVILGSLGGIGLAFLVEYFDNTIGTPEELESRFQVPVLGVIEDISQADNKEVKKYLYKQPHSSFSENLKMIRSLVLLSAPDHPPKSILLTSSIPSEGKTTITVNFAKTLAMQGGRVVVLDGDLRNPSLHDVFGVEDHKGLSSYLAGTAELKTILQPCSPLIDVIPAGQIPPNPSELLGSKKMKELLAAMEKEYDFVLLDSAPLLSVTDSLTLAAMTDGTILITQVGRTSNDMLKSSLKRLHSIDASILGIIMNRAKISHFDEYNYMGYYATSYGDSTI